MIRKAALQIAALALLALIAFNTFLAYDHLKRTHNSAALSLESSGVQASIARVWQDFTDMETGQRGFLLTDDAAYLQPYADAKSSIGAHFANLRSALANRPESQGMPKGMPERPSEQSLETQLESLAASKQAEIERTIALRQQGYRRRAFQMVQTNEGKEYMDQARELVSQLSSMENSRFAAFEKERDASSTKALSETIVSNLGLLVLTAGLFMLIRYHERSLEQEAARTKQALALRDSQLEKLTSLMSAIGDQTRAQIAVIEENARLLLQKYGGFLPPVGYECAEHIKEATAQLEHLRKDLLGRPESDLQEKAA
jgi:CHASE3 domain sensor protein